MRKNKVWLSSPAMNGLEQQYVQQAFETNWIAPLGPNVDAFEKELSDRLGAGSALALISGTSAIHLALKAVGVETGDIVFCSSLTFAATCNPIIYQHAIPVFIDSEPDTWGMSPAALARAFKQYPKPKAVIVVNLYGTPAKLDQLASLCADHGVPMIEDAAESLGSTYFSNETGTFGDFGILSFNGNKIITTSGGGMLISKNREAIEKARFWSTQSRDTARHYQHSELGYNYRMSNVCAGIGRGQLQTLDLRIRQKTAIYRRYESAFAQVENVKMNPIPDNCKSNHWLSCLTIYSACSVRPIDLLVALENENIESRPIWKPMNLQPFYAGYDFFSHNEGSTSVGEDIFDCGICLPSDVNMCEDEQDSVIDIIRNEFLTKPQEMKFASAGV